MTRSVFSAVALFALWLLMSGVYKPMIIGFGAVASVISVYIVHRMNKVDKIPLDLPINPLRILTYLVWLMKEIAKSNIAVTKLILSRNVQLRQHLFHVANTQRSDIGKVIFANSITLTPGTITVETEDQSFWVHAVSYASSDHEDLADMDARVSAIELKSL